MARQGLAQKALCRRQIAMLTEPELNGVTDAVDGAIEIHPFAADLDIGFIRMPFRRHFAPAQIEAFRKLRREMNDPAVNCRMVDADAAFGQHFLQIPQAEIVGKIPPQTQQNDR